MEAIKNNAHVSLIARYSHSGTKNLERKGGMTSKRKGSAVGRSRLCFSSGKYQSHKHRYTLLLLENWRTLILLLTNGKKQKLVVSCKHKSRKPKELVWRGRESKKTKRIAMCRVYWCRSADCEFPRRLLAERFQRRAELLSIPPVSSATRALMRATLDSMAVSESCQYTFQANQRRGSVDLLSSPLVSPSSVRALWLGRL